MTKVPILGAHGQIARAATRLPLDATDAHVTLYPRRATRLTPLANNARVRLIEGDVLDTAILESAMAGQDVVYANLSGDMERQARAIVAAMRKGQPFANPRAYVSRESVADLVVKLVTGPGFGIGESLGVHAA